MTDSTDLGLPELPVGRMAWLKREVDENGKEEMDNLFFVQLPLQPWRRYTEIPAIAVLGKRKPLDTPLAPLPFIPSKANELIEEVAQSLTSSFSDGWFAYLALKKQGWQLVSEREVLQELSVQILSTL